MSSTSPAPITDIVATLSPDEQDSVVDYIDWMRGVAVFDGLSVEDHAEIERRASTIAPETLITVEDAMHRLSQRWSRSAK
jgi:hypothetical protein